MPFRLDPDKYPLRAKIQFTCSAQMPSLVYKACLRTGVVSNTVYVQHAVCEALARDLDIPIEDLLVNLPLPRGRANHLMGMDRKPLAGPANTIEEVR